jgi:glycerol uptake facilitator-like aquaporin
LSIVHMSAPAPANPLQTPDIARRLVAEALGTALLIAIVVGSGIRAERLAAGDIALALLCNALATGAGLVALLVSLGPVSGGHFNPVVTLSQLVQGALSPRAAVAYVSAQLTGAVLGVMAAHAMFGLPLLSMSMQMRTGAPMWWSECVASFGLIGWAWPPADAGRRWCHSWWPATSRRATGSPPRRRSPTRR